MSGEQQQFDEVEGNGIVLRAHLVVQCSECGTELACDYELATVPDPDQLAEPEAPQCAVCSQTQGLPVVIPVVIAAGLQVAQLLHEDEPDDGDSDDGGGGDELGDENPDELA